MIDRAVLELDHGVVLLSAELLDSLALVAVERAENGFVLDPLILQRLLDPPAVMVSDLQPGDVASVELDRHRCSLDGIYDDRMRIWDVDPALLCRSHLLGEHRELHAIWTILSEDRRGYRSHPETIRWEGKLAALSRRHDELVAEMAVAASTTTHRLIARWPRAPRCRRNSSTRRSVSWNCLRQAVSVSAAAWERGLADILPPLAGL